MLSLREFQSGKTGKRVNSVCGVSDELGVMSKGGRRFNVFVFECCITGPAFGLGGGSRC